MIQREGAKNLALHDLPLKVTVRVYFFVGFFFLFGWFFLVLHEQKS